MEAATTTLTPRTESSDVSSLTLPEDLAVARTRKTISERNPQWTAGKPSTYKIVRKASA